MHLTIKWHPVIIIKFSESIGKKNEIGIYVCNITRIPIIVRVMW